FLLGDGIAIFVGGPTLVGQPVSEQSLTPPAVGIDVFLDGTAPPVVVCVVTHRNDLQIQLVEGEFHQRTRAFARVATPPKSLPEPYSEGPRTAIPIDFECGVAGVLARASFAI